MNMLPKKRVYYYKPRKNLKKLFLKIFIILIVFEFIIPTGISTYDNVNNNLLVPEYLEVGDLLFCDMDMEFVNTVKSLGFDIPYTYTQPGPSNDHVAMYIGNDQFIEASPYHRGDDGKLHGVLVSDIGLIKLWGKNLKYAKIDVSDDLKENAVKWALSQIGQPYQSDYINKNADPLDKSDQYSDEWYCTELVWAAYKNQGLNLDDAEEGIVTILDIQSSSSFVFYNQEVEDNSKVNANIPLLISCLLDLEEDKKYF